MFTYRSGSRTPSILWSKCVTMRLHLEKSPPGHFCNKAKSLMKRQLTNILMINETIWKVTHQ